VNPAPRILLLDDDDDIRRICVEVLAQSGFEVDAAADGEAGWAALQERHYDLLITDNDMPKLTGLELVKKVCASGMKVAVIFASGSLSFQALREQPSLRQATELPKPFSPDELVGTVRRVLRGEAAMNLSAA
jgi:DNA-binding response OmpR family regulator